MRCTTAVLVTLGLATLTVASASIRAQQPAAADAAAVTVWDGVYTADQATRGEAAYQKECSSCHGDDLMGDGFAPPLAGTDFANTWNGTTLADLFDRMRVSMPPNDPSAVSSDAKVVILSFVLKMGHFPAGEKELPSQAEALKLIQFQATKP
jgi:mono/diheme cytochrome c family protein